MNQSVSKWILALALTLFPLGCLVLTFLLINTQPQIDAEEVTTVPRPARINQLPDLAEISHIPDRKETFIELLIPMIEWRNSLLLDWREEVLQMQASLTQGKALTRVQRQRLDMLRERYKVTEENYPTDEEALDILKLRVDIIPKGMALAQAAVESGWGTSRFAVQANNIFGQWCFRKGCGLVPKNRREGAKHEVQKFATVNEAIDAYYRNINTHRAYRELRQKRAQLRKQDLPITGEVLVGGLLRYSSRGEVYVEELRELIRYNDLANAEILEETLEATPAEPDEG